MQAMASIINSVQSSPQVTSSSLSHSMTVANNQKKFLSFINKAINEYLRLHVNDAAFNLVEEFVPYYTYSMILIDQNSIPQQHALEPSQCIHQNEQSLTEARTIQPLVSQSKYQKQRACVQPQQSPGSIKRKLDEILYQNNSDLMPLTQAAAQHVSDVFPKAHEPQSNIKQVKTPKLMSTPVQLASRKSIRISSHSQTTTPKAVQTDCKLYKSSKICDSDDSYESPTQTPIVNNLKCIECNFVALCTSEFIKHQRHHGRKLKFKCKFCSFSHDIKCFTRRHQNKYH